MNQQLSQPWRSGEELTEDEVIDPGAAGGQAGLQAATAAEKA